MIKRPNTDARIRTIRVPNTLTITVSELKLGCPFLSLLLRVFSGILSGIFIGDLFNVILGVFPGDVLNVILGVFPRDLLNVTLGVFPGDLLNVIFGCWFVFPCIGILSVGFIFAPVVEVGVPYTVSQSSSHVFLQSCMPLQHLRGSVLFNSCTFY